MLQRFFYYPILIVIFCPLYVRADEYRFIRGEAIISSAYNNSPTVRTNSKLNYQLNRLSSPSFSSLSHERISNQAIKVSILRKAKNSKTSERFLKSRNPCNTASIKRLLRLSKSLICEPDWEVNTTLTPNDTLFGQLYSASTTSAAKLFLPGAWNLSTGSSNTVVGIIDTGIDYNHPDLQANMWVNPGEIAGNGIDDDGNGFIDDIHGYDAYNNDSDPFDDQSHGTHVAGTIGAVGNNSKGVVGINWNVKEIGCKAFGATGTGPLSAVINCVNYLVNLKKNFGINIVAFNNSYGGFPYSISMLNAIKASRDADIVFVAGAGNDSRDNDITPFYPASYDVENVISVAAVDSGANKAGFSNYGATSVDIAAPGVNILSTIPSNNYAYYNGTSMATPHVTGAVALLLSYKPDYKFSQAVSSILNTGTVISSMSGKCLTGALLNVEEAMKYSAPAPTPTPENIAPLPTTPSEPTQPDLSSASLRISVKNSKTRSNVTCRLLALNGSDSLALQNYAVNLKVKGMNNSFRAITNQNGQVNFKVRPQRNRTYSAYCVLNTLASLKSKTVRLKLMN